MHGWMKTIVMPILVNGTKELARLFECMFNIISAISKDIILHLMVLPIQLMVIFLSYTPAAHEALGHSGSLLVTYKHIYIYLRIIYQLCIFSP